MGLTVSFPFQACSLFLKNFKTLDVQFQLVLALAFSVSCSLAYPQGPTVSAESAEVADASSDQHEGNLEMSATPAELGSDDARVSSNVRPKRTVLVIGRPYGYVYGNYGYGYGRIPYYGGYPGYWRRPYYGY